MSNKLENFLQDNKDEFDGHEPSEALWHRVEKKLDLPKKNGLLTIMSSRSWLSAAAAVLIISGAAIFLLNRRTTTTGPILTARVEPKSTLIKPDTVMSAASDPARETQPQTETASTTLPDIKPDDPALEDKDALQSIASQELMHYTKLVELKQQQITILKKDEPLLYKQFASDFAKIDEEYTQLKKQKDGHPNNELLLEAMIQNLHLQSALLTRQLEIVKNINNNKQKRYEKTYNSTI